MPLFPKHIDHLKQSGLTEKTLEEHGFRSLSADEVAKQLQWKKGTLSAGFLILYPQGGGEYYQDFFRVRLDEPYVFKNQDEKQGAYFKKQREAKYLSPKGVKVRLYIPHSVWGILNDINIPLIWTEGEKKALKATQDGFPTISLPGVWGWQRGKELIEDFDQINLQGRVVYIVFDSDKATNENVQLAEKQFAKALLDRGARVFIVDLPQE